VSGAAGRRLAVAMVIAVAASTVAGASAKARPPLPATPPSNDFALCGQGHVNSRPLWFRAADGVVLAGALYGRGSRGVVLAPESNGSHCGWLGFARHLAAAGYRVLAYDLRGLGQSPVLGRKASVRYDLDVVGAVRELHRRGARTVVVAGASLGGAAVLAAGPALSRTAAGVVDFSGEPELAGAAAALPRIRLPLLVVGSRTDPLADASVSRHVLAAAGSADKSLLLLAGGNHGWDLVERDASAARARAAVLRWLAQHDR
jgi:alpha-beta hydrolase superfamily lysophospholipase